MSSTMGQAASGTPDNTEYNIQHALDVIRNDYGIEVSVEEKAKDLLKFGRNQAVGTAGATIMTLAGSETNETYVNRNLITHFASGSTSDTEKIVVEGHTVGDDVSVSSITQDSGTATVTTSSAHGFEVNEWVYIEGANESGYNGIVKVDTVPSTTTFTYEVASGTSSPATGTITVNSQKKTFVSQTVTLAGQTKTALTTELARVTRAYVPSQNKATDLVGPIYIAEDVTFTSGVPQTDSAVHLIIRAGKNQSEKAATSLSDSDFWIVTSFRGSILEKGTTPTADVEFQIREVGGVFREREDVSASTGTAGVFPFGPYAIVPANADIRLFATASTNGTDVTGSIQGYLAIKKQT